MELKTTKLQRSKHEKWLKRSRDDESDTRFIKGGLKKESLFSGDSWSLGMMFLELFFLECKILSPHESEQEIKEVLRAKQEKAEKSKRYGKLLLSLIFGFLDLDPKRRLKVSDVKIKLEEEFGNILTEEFRTNLGLLKSEDQKGIKQNERDQAFIQETDKILKIFEENLKKKEEEIIELEAKIRELQTNLLDSELEVERLKLQNKNEIEVNWYQKESETDQTNKILFGSPTNNEIEQIKRTYDLKECIRMDYMTSIYFGLQIKQMKKIGKSETKGREKILDHIEAFRREYVNISKPLILERATVKGSFDSELRSSIGILDTESNDSNSEKQA